MMKTPFLGLLLAVVCLPSFAALKVGDQAPDFTLPASFAGKSAPYSLKEQLKKGPLVVYFFPSAYTQGCNIQAHNFSENSAKFTAAGASILGVSLDSITRLNDFSADPKFCAGKISVASDADGKVAKQFDLNVNPGSAGATDTRGVAIDHGFAERTTFVIGTDGKIISVIGGVTPVENVQKALQAVQDLAKEKSNTKT